MDGGVAAGVAVGLARSTRTFHSQFEQFGGDVFVPRLAGHFPAAAGMGKKAFDYVVGHRHGMTDSRSRALRP